MYPIGPGVSANIVIYFRTDVNDAQIESFLRDTLMQQTADHRGFDHRDGLGTILRVQDVEEHKAVAITFLRNATQNQREHLKSEIQNSPIVFKLLENVVPKDVKSIE